MLHFEDDKTFPLSTGDLWVKLRDARFLAQCIPGAEAVSRSELDVAVCTLRPGFSFMRGTIEVTLEVRESVEGESVCYHVHGKGIGSSNDVDAALAFVPQDGGTKVHWTADVVQLGGLLRTIPRGLIQAAARKVIDDMWTAVAGKLTATKD